MELHAFRTNGANGSQMRSVAPLESPLTSATRIFRCRLVGRRSRSAWLLVFCGYRCDNIIGQERRRPSEPAANRRRRSVPCQVDHRSFADTTRSSAGRIVAPEGAADRSLSSEAKGAKPGARPTEPSIEET